MKRLKKVLFIVLAAIIIFIAGGYIYVKAMLPNVGAAPDLKVELTPENIERGRYIANYVAVCKDCHTQRDPFVFTMPVKENIAFGGGEIFDEKLGFPGKIVAPNITPYKLKSWTDGEIYRAITAGVNKSGKALFPLMPYHGYGQLDDKDIKAVIAYLRTLPEVKIDPEETNLKFPVSLIVNTIPHKGSPATMPDTTDKIAYGKYMVTMGNCIDCHSKKDDKGNMLAGLEFAGGFEFKIPTGSCFSANLTADKESGLGNWSEETFVSRFKQYDSAYVPATVKSGFNTIMPWMLYGKMKTSDLKAMYAYLQTLKPVKNQVVKFVPNEGK